MTDTPYCAHCSSPAHPGECYPELRDAGLRELLRQLGEDRRKQEAELARVREEKHALAVNLAESTLDNGRLRALLREGSVLMYEDPNLAWGRQNNWQNRVADVLAQPEPAVSLMDTAVAAESVAFEPADLYAEPMADGMAPLPKGSHVTIPPDWPTYAAGLTKPWGEEDAKRDLRHAKAGPDEPQEGYSYWAKRWGWMGRHAADKVRELWASGAWRA